ncbi:YiiD C-terminal domain-containing protein [Aerosticca soli]|jgi:thioesterase domain-containing protein|uniref:Histone acetyltransferase HPA2 and related acetyltransferases n=1 Tax=Aerosticca soli TaxID=2010829 RepID=A0A2Z6E3D8_9GAMM|nr:YiiD C-terminal domain-containing protein [Aerosticca soli]MDI3263120.1 YiiD C-terminal domain-containing protein [Fulvimonas sp.]BBD79089.1 histone acetyltransferase HPA2 and related acetyltransferases [Aerosticca soli]
MHAHPSAQALVDFIRDEIPLARAMDVRLYHCGEGVLSLAAPLAPNVNDKGCAFGGSLVSLMTLAGWGLVELALRNRSLACDVFVADSSVRYLAPVWQDFRAEARVAEEASWPAFFAALDERGRASLPVLVQVPGEDAPAATLQARFAARRRG